MTNNLGPVTVTAYVILVAYAVIAGMLMYTFIYDQLPTGQLTLLVTTLAVFAVDIPMMLARCTWALIAFAC